MFIWTLKFDKKKAVFIIVMAALILIGIIMLAGIDTSKAASAQNNNADSEEARAAYLSALGWKVEVPALSREDVLIPKTFSEVFEEYNELQKSQGFDLSKYAGKELTLFTYKVTNHESDDTVFAELYVHKGEVVGGDIHSAALDGFMSGLKK